MNTTSDLIRALARALGPSLHPPPACRDERAAARLVLRVAHGARCPRCDARALLVDGRRARCVRAHVFSLTCRTGLHHTKIRFAHWMSAIWHLHVDREPISARAFATRYRLRHATAWALLHEVRAALIAATPRRRGASAPIARRNGRPSARAVHASRDGAALILVDEPSRAPPAGGRAREASLFIGRARAWITTVFCGVSDRYLHLYLAEYAARFGRRACAA